MNYEITEEQIKELAKTKHGKRCTKKWFPEVFETPVTVGNWYKSDYPLLIYIEEIHQHKLVGYGFNSDYYYLETQDFCKRDENNSVNYKKHNFRLATDSEVEEALKNEAKKRGFKEGVYVNNSNICELGTTYLIEKNSSFELLPNNLLVCGNNCVVIFNKGKWAEIIKTYTKEKAEKLLNAKII